MVTKRHARTAALTLAAVTAFTFAGAGAAQAEPAIPLTGGQEVPKPTAFGAHGWFTYEIDGTQFCYSLEVDGLSTPAVNAHVHLAPRNEPGPVRIQLGFESATSFEVSDCVTISGTLADAIEQDPGAYYVNVHTSMNMPGEIRGQLK
jgi:hypothetical protein